MQGVPICAARANRAPAVDAKAGISPVMGGPTRHRAEVLRPLGSPLGVVSPLTALEAGWINTVDGPNRLFPAWPLMCVTRSREDLTGRLLVNRF